MLAEKDYKILGRLLGKKYPDLARELLATYKDHPPLETDHQKIPTFFKIFCFHLSVDEKELLGPLYKTSKVDVRRLFVACMTHLYYPHVYHQPPEEINLSKKGFVSSLSRALQQQEPNISVMIREVIAWEKDYDDFKEKVYSIVEKLKEVA